MDAVVAKAKEAQNFAASQVSKSFNGKGTVGAPAMRVNDRPWQSSQGRSAFRNKSRQIYELAPTIIFCAGNCCHPVRFPY